MFFLWIYHISYRVAVNQFQMLSDTLVRHHLRNESWDSFRVNRILQLVLSRVFFVCHVLFCYFCGYVCGLVFGMYMQVQDIGQLSRWLGCDFALYFGCIFGAFLFVSDQELTKVS